MGRDDSFASTLLRPASDRRRQSLDPAEVMLARAADATVCPSEVARLLAADAGDAMCWRAAMPVVHSAVDRMVREGRVRLSWKGRALDRRDGPYRIYGVATPARLQTARP